MSPRVNKQKSGHQHHKILNFFHPIGILNTRVHRQVVCSEENEVVRGIDTGPSQFCLESA
jgi:hypothetical protein